MCGWLACPFDKTTSGHQWSCLCALLMTVTIPYDIIQDTAHRCGRNVGLGHQTLSLLAFTVKGLQCQLDCYRNLIGQWAFRIHAVELYDMHVPMLINFLSIGLIRHGKILYMVLYCSSLWSLIPQTYCPIVS